MLVYYLLNGPKWDGTGNITAFPDGFQMLAGSRNLRNFTGPVPDTPWYTWTGNQSTQFALGQKAVGFNCLNYQTTPEPSLYRHFMPPKDYIDANCANGVRAELMLPSCWNGIDLDSPDHKSHVAYPQYIQSGVCPDGFPYKMPGLFFETIWNTWAFKGVDGEFVWSHGDPTGESAEIWITWTPLILPRIRISWRLYDGVGLGRLFAIGCRSMHQPLWTDTRLCIVRHSVRLRSSRLFVRGAGASGAGRYCRTTSGIADWRAHSARTSAGHELQHRVSRHFADYYSIISHGQRTSRNNFASKSISCPQWPRNIAVSQRAGTAWSYNHPRHDNVLECDPNGLSAISNTVFCESTSNLAFESIHISCKHNHSRDCQHKIHDHADRSHRADRREDIHVYDRDRGAYAQRHRCRHKETPLRGSGAPSPW